MNKLFIVLLAVCLVSVHAFVRRDAPETPQPNTLDGLKQQVQDAFSSVNEQLKGVFNPEEVKKAFNEAVDGITKAVSDLQGKQEAPKQ